MALDDLKAKYIPKDNDFYRLHYHQVIYLLMGLIVLLMFVVTFVLYQMYNRPLPQFNAIQPDGKRMLLIPYDAPNQLPDTILRWASKAATTAYTFDFLNYKSQIGAARIFFTDNGWQGYLNSVSGLIDKIVAAQLFVNGVVSGTPIISNQGDLPGVGESWRVQIPFLVTWQSSNQIQKDHYTVVLVIVKVPTSVNPAGIGIDQFIMV
jgi:intracellular multiplication protein IcmL